MILTESRIKQAAEEARRQRLDESYGGAAEILDLALVKGFQHV